MSSFSSKSNPNAALTPEGSPCTWWDGNHRLHKRQRNHIPLHQKMGLSRGEMIYLLGELTGDTNINYLTHWLYDTKKLRRNTEFNGKNKYKKLNSMKQQINRLRRDYSLVTWPLTFNPPEFFLINAKSTGRWLPLKKFSNHTHSNFAHILTFFALKSTFLVLNCTTFLHVLTKNKIEQNFRGQTNI